MAEIKKSKVVINTNSWMATYTDLMILLLTFFVLLLSLATVDKRRKRLALNSLVGAFGFKPGGQSILGKPKGLNITTGSAPLAPEEIQFERLRNVALKHGLKSELSMTKQLDRTILVMDNRLLFKEKSAQIKDTSIEFLSDLADVLKTGPKLIELRGYADSSESIMEEEPFKYSIMLSSQRAIAVFDFFMNKGIPSETMVAHGFGLNYRGVGEKSKKSYLNRQVEIILDYREKVPYRIRKPRRSESLLDFKGFFFRNSMIENDNRKSK
jgi:chemotaxis protein MotB